MIKLGIIGLGYVGLPLAHVFAKKYAVVGFDIDTTRVSQLNGRNDETNELSAQQLDKVLNQKPNGLKVTNVAEDLKDCNYYIITVPTPVDENNKPNLEALEKASITVGKMIDFGDIVIYESTVFPGATEEFCVPILEKLSSLVFNTDFFVGYSPERINPADKRHTVDKILKVTSGSTKEIAARIDQLYNTVITAGTYLAPSIKVAEAAKVIENSQRDINIAFVNELAKIFNLLDIDTHEVLKAAATKWNFLPFKPGLVGGHCIGVDPYYLAQKAMEVGYHPEIILAGRRLNDSMGKYVSSEVVKLMLQRDIKIKRSSVLILGVTFKEDCPDVRNTRVIDTINDLKEYGVKVTVMDPIANVKQVKNQLGLQITNTFPKEQFDSIVLAVAHSEFYDMDLDSLKSPACVVYDVKGILGNKADKRL